MIHRGLDLWNGLMRCSFAQTLGFPFCRMNKALKAIFIHLGSCKIKLVSVSRFVTLENHCTVILINCFVFLFRQMSGCLSPDDVYSDVL